MPLVLLASASERRRQILSEYLEDGDTSLEFCILREPEQEATSGMEVNLQVESSCIGKAMAAVKERASEGNVADIILVSDTLWKIQMMRGRHLGSQRMRVARHSA